MRAEDYPEIIVMRYTTERGIVHYVRAPVIAGDLKARIAGDVDRAKHHGDPIRDAAVLNLTEGQYMDLPVSDLTGRVFGEDGE